MPILDNDEGEMGDDDGDDEFLPSLPSDVDSEIGESEMKAESESESEPEPVADYGSKWQRDAFKKRHFFEVMPLDDTDGVCLYRLYTAVKFRGGFDCLCLRQESWPVLASFLRTNATVPKLMHLYQNFLLPFEEKERERLRYLKQKSIPYWWDYGDYLSYKVQPVPNRKKPYHVITRQNLLVEIYIKYIPSYGNIFCIKDSWLYVTDVSPSVLQNIMKTIK